jgi:hypothetical protein
MPIDPRHDAIGDPARATNQRINDAHRRVSALERQPRVQTGNGPPTKTCRDGTLYVDVLNLLLYVHAAGAWHSAALS